MDLTLIRTNSLASMLLLLLLCACSKPTYADVYAAMVDLETLAETEAKASALLLKRVFALSSWTEYNLLKRKLEDYETLIRGSVKESFSFLKRPFNAYLFMERVLTFWQDNRSILLKCCNDTLEEVDKLREEAGIDLPTEADLDAATVGLFRLQDTYGLTVAKIVGRRRADDGRSNDETFSLAATAADCYDIGYKALHNKDSYHALPWLFNTWQMLKDETDKPSIDPQLVLVNLGIAMFNQGNVEWAVHFSEKLFLMENANVVLIYDLQKRMKKYKTALEKAGKYYHPDKLPQIVNKKPQDMFDTKEQADYEALCRNSLKGTPGSTNAVSPNLYCFYQRTTPFLQMAPLKAEILNESPRVLIFRNVLSDLESAAVVAAAKPKLQRSRVFDKLQGNVQEASFRVAKNAWLADNESDVVRVVSRRCYDMTGLDVTSAEQLQVANYGFGGHYNPHFDFYKPDASAKAFKESGNRIATILFYITEPEAGGATAFTKLGLSVPATKNDALVWFNLHRSGNGNERTRHAGCPVLEGVKWVANKWLHEAGQEFRWPCLAEPLTA